MDPNPTPEKIKAERLNAFEKAAVVFTGEVVSLDRAQRIIELHETVLTGRATELERERYERCIEIINVGRARLLAQQTSKP